MWPDQMCAEDPPGVLFNERFVTVHTFADAAGRVPVCCLGGIDAQVWYLLARCGFGKANRSDRRQREGDAGDATIVRAVMVPLPNIGCNGLAIVAPFWRQWGTLGSRTTASIDRRIGDALQKFVQGHLPLSDRDSGRRQVERVMIGSAASGMNHEIGVDRDLSAVRTGTHTETAARALDC